MDIIEVGLRYVVLPLLSVLWTVGWFMLKKQDSRIDLLEARANSTEKDVIEMRTELRKDIQYMAEDVKEIKDILTSK